MSEYLQDNNSQVVNELPWLVFKLHNLTYTINSHIVTSILQITDNITPVASAPEIYKGVYNFRGNALPLLDLRKFFGMKSCKEECDEFKEMIQARKQDHINYVNELENCVNSKSAFTLTLDPHSCKLGRWLDELSTRKDSNAVSIKKFLSTSDLITPHENIHLLAKKIMAHKQDSSTCDENECIKINLLNRVKENRDKVLDLLDDLVTSFLNSYREMIVIVSDENISLGLVVDEVVAVDELVILSENDRFPNFQKTRYFNGIAQNSKIEGEILIVNEDYLLNIFEKHKNVF